MQYVLLILVGILCGIAIEGRKELIKALIIALIFVLLWFWGANH